MDEHHSISGFPGGLEKKYAGGILDSIMDMVPGGLVGISFESRDILFAGGCIFDMAGYGREEIQVSCHHRCLDMIVFPQDRECVKAFITAQSNASMSGQAKAISETELGFRIMKRDGGLMWVRAFAGRLPDSPWGSCLLLYLLDDTQRVEAAWDAEGMRRKMGNLMNTIPGGVARLCLSDNNRIVMATDRYYALTGYSREECGQAPIYGNALNFVLEEDLPKVNAAIDKLIRNNSAVSVDYRIRMKNGDVSQNTAYCSKVEQAGDQIYIDIIVLDSTLLERSERRLAALTNSIPGGVVRLHVDDDIYIDYANEGFYRLAGYPEDEFNGEGIHRRYTRIILPEDREMVLDRVKSFVASRRDCPSLDYRILTKAGKVRWMRASAARVPGGLEEKNSVQCVLIDITESRRAEEESLINAERYRIIAEQAQDIIFTWNLGDGSIRFSPVFESKFGFPPPAQIYDRVFEEDRPIVDEAVSRLKAGESYVVIEYRFRAGQGRLIWCRTRMTVIHGSDKRQKQVVGIIIDIDEDKRAAAQMQKRAETDALTGLPNRGTVQQLVESHLKHCGPDQNHAFLLIDIDNFKWVNDTFGHQRGDEVLSDASALLREQVRPCDVAGRLGGDEFVVFMDDVPSVEQVMEIAARLGELFNHSFSFGKDPGSVSISIGIALSPAHGTTFDELYRNADKALYESKNHGRNRYSIYSPPG